MLKLAPNFFDLVCGIFCLDFHFSHTFCGVVSYNQLTSAGPLVWEDGFA